MSLERARDYDYEETAMRRQAPLDVALDALDKSMATLHENFTMLVNRLELVTQPSESRPEVPTGGTPANTRPVSPATGHIDEISNQLYRITDRIKDLMDRLDT